MGRTFRSGRLGLFAVCNLGLGMRIRFGRWSNRVRFKGAAVRIAELNLDARALGPAHRKRQAFV